MQQSLRFPSSLADNRAEFNNLLVFYLGATDKYNKLCNHLINEEIKLSHLKQNFIKLMLGTLDEMHDEAHVLSDFSKQLGRVNQLKLAIEQQFRTKQETKARLTLLAKPEIVKFYLSRIDPCDAANLKNTETNLFLDETIPATSYYSFAAPTEYCAAPATFYYSPLLSFSCPVEVVQPIKSQLFYSM